LTGKTYPFPKSDPLFPEGGVSVSFHGGSHHQDDPAQIKSFSKLNRYHLYTTAYLANKLKATPDGVAALVYIAALAPDADETSQSQQEKYPVTEVFSHIAVADGRIWMLPEGVESFAGDLSEQEKKFVWATHFAPAADLFTQKLDGVGWRSKPSWYVVAKNDHTVQPELQRFLAKGMGPLRRKSPAAMFPCSPTLIR
jgi:hypothetical protein